jgi:drug/metabolite transporter (DMT)-like permease
MRLQRCDLGIGGVARGRGAAARHPVAAGLVECATRLLDLVFNASEAPPVTGLAAKEGAMASAAEQAPAAEQASAAEHLASVQAVAPGLGSRLAGWQGAFLLLAAIWGSSFLFIKVGLEVLSPLQVALGRMVFGTVTLLVILLVRRERLPRDRRLWGHLAVTALLLNALPFSLFAYGETAVSSIVAGIWNATTPLLTLVVVLVALPEERPTRRRVVGLLIGFVGVLIVLGGWRGLEAGALLGNLACLAAAASYGLGFPYSRRYLASRPESVLALSTAQLLCGTAELLLVTPLPTLSLAAIPVRVLISVALLGAVGTGIAYMLNNRVIREAGATTASTVTYLIPLFSTIAGLLLLDERVSWHKPVGGLIVLLGVAVSQGRLRWRGAG